MLFPPGLATLAAAIVLAARCLFLPHGSRHPFTSPPSRLALMPSPRDPMPWTPIAIALGAVLGALSRDYVTRFCLHHFGDRWPYGTLFANLTGSLLMGMGAAMLRPLDGAMAVKFFVFVGFLGAYTTFSSYILDILTLYRRGQLGRSVAYGLGSAIAGLLSLCLGYWLGMVIG